MGLKLISKVEIYDSKSCHAYAWNNNKILNIQKLEISVFQISKEAGGNSR